MSETTVRQREGSRRTAQDRRECIIAAARSLFAQRGFHGTGMAQIASASRVLVGQIYRDFAGKEDLIAAIVMRDVSELLDDPELAGATEAGEPTRLKSWVRRFITRPIDDQTRSLLADILSEATRNAGIAELLMKEHSRMRERLTEAAKVWAPEPEKGDARRDLADLILTTTGAVQHRQIVGLAIDASAVEKFVHLVEREIDRLRGSG